MSPVSAVLLDLAGVEEISLQVRPDFSVDGVTIAVVGAESRLEILIDPLSAIDLSLEIIGSVTRLQEDE